MSNPLSVVIITKNEENFIKDAVKSAQFADEVIVLDNYSADKTCEIAKKLGAKVFQKEWQGYGVQKNIAVSLASNDWVFVLDSDERITTQLKNEIIETLKNPLFDGYKIARLNFFFGKKTLLRFLKNKQKKQTSLSKAITVNSNFSVVGECKDPPGGGPKPRPWGSSAFLKQHSRNSNFE